MLCRPCTDIFSGKWRFHDSHSKQTRRPCTAYLIQHDSFESFVNCSLQGQCKLCISLWDRFCHYMQWKRAEQAYKAPIPGFGIKCRLAGGKGTVYYDLDKKDVPCVELEWSVFGQGNISKYLASFELWPEHLMQHHLSSTSLDSNTASPHSISFVRMKLSNCLRSHKKCKQIADSKPLKYRPTRLIDVGTQGDSMIRLKETFEINDPTSYVSLSHCWGGASVFKLTSKTLHQLKRGIELSLLPRTFQDAITTTKALGERFIWIDSLCILQDSIEDWSAEATKMQSVYKYAQCNISASYGTNSNDGLFRERIPNAIQPFPVSTSWEQDSVKLLDAQGDYHGLQAGQFYCMDINLWRDDVEESPLSSRAWVTQERLLSPRTVYFGWRQIYWQCSENESCEIFPVSDPESSAPSTAGWSRWVNGMGIRKALEEYSDIKAAEQKTKVDVPSQHRQQLEELHRRWRHLVLQYSTRQLTRDEDIFVALSGLVNEFSDRTGEEWQMGFWKGQLPHDLLWLVEWEHSSISPRTANSSVRPSAWRAPSWSWAAVKRPINFPWTATRCREELEILGIETAKDVWGRYTSANLKVRTSLCTGRLSRRHTISEGQIQQHIIVFFECGPKGLMRVKIHLDESPKLPPDFSQVHFIPVISLLGNKGPEQVAGLLLVPAGSRKGTFNRCGMFHFSDSCEVMFSRDNVDDWAEFEEWNGKANGYTLTIA